MFAGFCALSGVFCLTLPIPIIVNSFAGFYKNRLWRNEVELKKKERTLQLAAELRQAQKLHLIRVGHRSFMECPRCIFVPDFGLFSQEKLADCKQ